jgi:Beta-lactamase superfamily domain
VAGDPRQAWERSARGGDPLVRPQLRARPGAGGDRPLRPGRPRHRLRHAPADGRPGHPLARPPQRRQPGGGPAHPTARQPAFQILRGPGEYEIHDTFVTGIRTYHDEAKGAERGHNTVYLIELEGMVVCHLGDLGHALTEEQAEAMANVDVLIVPAGGGDVLDPTKAAELIGQLEPKVVLPIRFATPHGDAGLGGVDAFAKALGVEVPPAEEKLTLRHSDLGETVRLVVLTPESEGRR